MFSPATTICEARAAAVRFSLGFETGGEDFNSSSSKVLNHIPEVTSLRPIQFPMFNGVHHNSSKLPSGVRYFSSAESASHTVLAMPALSPTMSQGNIARWTKKEGDKIEVGDVLCEIETDKATLEFESLEEGYYKSVILV